MKKSREEKFNSYNANLRGVHEEKLSFLRSVKKRSKKTYLLEEYSNEIDLLQKRRRYLRVARQNPVKRLSVEPKSTRDEYMLRCLRFDESGGGEKLTESQFMKLIYGKEFRFHEYIPSRKKKPINALIYACHRGFTLAFDYLLQNIDPSWLSQRAVVQVCESTVQDDVKHVEILQKLLKDPRVDPSVRFQEPLRVSVKAGNFDVVKLLLTHEKVCPEYSHLLCACKRGFSQIVEYLLFVDRRVNALLLRNQCLQTSLYNKHVECVKMLLKVPRMYPRKLALQLACKSRKKNLIKMILLHVNSNVSVETSLQIAHKYGGLDYIASLVGLMKRRRKKRSTNAINRDMEALFNGELIEKKVAEYILNEVCYGNLEIAGETLTDIVQSNTSGRIIEFLEQREMMRSSLNLNLNPTTTEHENKNNVFPSLPEVNPEILEYPPEFECPISLQIMKDPVIVVASGNTYERECIVSWFQNSNLDPLTGLELDLEVANLNKDLRSNLELQQRIEKWRRSCSCE